MLDKPIEQSYVHVYMDRITQTKKGFYVFLLQLFGACVLLAFAGLLFDSRFLFLIQLICFLSLGGLYTVVVHKKLSVIEKKEAFPYALFLSFAILIFLTVASFVFNGIAFFDVVAFASAFLLPSVVAESWRLYQAIPEADHAAWYYTSEIPAQPIFVYLDKKPIRLKLVMNHVRSFEVPTMTPTSLNLGTAFYYIAKDLDNSGERLQFFLTEEKQPYGWVFYIKKLGFWKRYLNPEDTLEENNIKANTVIVAKRLD